MDFNVELTEFPSAVHSAIYTKGRGLMPLSRTLDAVVDSVMRESCVALHGFMLDMLSDMYEHPEAYHLPIMEWENFLGGKPMVVVRNEFPKKIKAVEARTRHAAYMYMDVLWRIGDGGQIEGNDFVVSEEELKVISKRANATTSPIPLDKRLEALSRVGFIMEVLPENKYRFISKNYPSIFLALNALSHDDFCMLEFRGINSKYKPTHDDFFYPLITGQRELAYELHDFAMERKLRPSTNANWGVVYQYKSKQVMTIRTGSDIDCSLYVGVVAKDKKEDHMVIDNHLGKEPKGFQEQALGLMSGCDANRCLMCSTYSSGNFVTVLGKRHQVCGEGIIRYEWYIPTTADMNMIKRLIEIRCESIDEAKKAKS